MVRVDQVVNGSSFLLACRIRRWRPLKLATFISH